MAAGRVAHRKLDQMETGPYQRALLRHGITTKVDAEDERILILQQAMEYISIMAFFFFITLINFIPPYSEKSEK